MIPTLCWLISKVRQTKIYLTVIQDRQLENDDDFQPIIDEWLKLEKNLFTFLLIKIDS